MHAFEIHTHRPTDVSTTCAAMGWRPTEYGRIVTDNFRPLATQPYIVVVVVPNNVTMADVINATGETAVSTFYP